MKLQLAPFQSFACHSCGRCCRNSWAVEVESPALAAIANSTATQERLRRGYIPLLLAADGRTVTGRDKQGACLYLEGDRLCELHAELGAEGKPLACQLYPFSLTATPDGYFASLSFACPVALWGHEGALEENRGQLERLLETRGHREAPLSHQVELLPGWSIPWANYRQLEAVLEERLARSAPALSLLGSVGSVLTILGPVARGSSVDWHALQANPAEDEFEIRLLEMVCASVVALLELPSQPTERVELSRRLLMGEELVSPRYGVVLPALSMHGELDELLLQSLSRYLSNALFGKSLLMGTVVSRLLLLSAGVALIDFYSELFATLTSSRQDAIGHAFELLEAELLTHSLSAQPLFTSLEATFCQAYGL